MRIIRINERSVFSFFFLVVGSLSTFYILCLNEILFLLKKKLLSSSGNCLSGAEVFGYVIRHPHWMTFMHYLRIHLAGFAHCKSLCCFV